jgi:hypothetical protein
MPASSLPALASLGNVRFSFAGLLSKLHATLSLSAATDMSAALEDERVLGQGIHHGDTEGTEKRISVRRAMRAILPCSVISVPPW